MKKLTEKQKSIVSSIKKCDIEALKISLSVCSPNFYTGSDLAPTPVHLAILKKDLESLKILISFGAEITEDIVNYIGMDPEDMNINIFLSEYLYGINSETKI